MNLEKSWITDGPVKHKTCCLKKALQTAPFSSLHYGYTLMSHAIFEKFANEVVGGDPDLNSKRCFHNVELVSSDFLSL